MHTTFATKVEEAKILWDMLQTAPHELCLATERPAKFSKAVEVMKQMAQDAHAVRQAAKQMVQESLAASQVPKQSARLPSPACADSKKVVELRHGQAC